ncbi:MAG TPA: Rieske (2Fe-2S) protein [Geobacteraceae bacterium]|nr:Rieske (2Fe-2S) protein [Geobacteraceae bacterium]
MIFAAKVSEVPNFGKKAVTVNGQELLLVNIKGQIFACENECPHQGSPLQAGIVKDGHLSCPRHGYRFDLKTGACMDHPEFTLKVFPLQLQGDEIMVDLG